MSNLEVNNASAPRFDGDFEVVVASGKTTAPDEQRYLEALQRVTEALSEDEREDIAVINGNPSAAARVEARRKQRVATAAELHAEADAVVADLLLADIAADNALVLKGKYVSVRERIAASLFVVGYKQDKAGRATDLIIDVALDLPSPISIPSPEKQALFVALDTASTVVKTVCQRMEDRANGWLHKIAPSSGRRYRERASRLLDQYIRKIAEIGRLGLEGDQVQLASIALDGLRSEFVAEEAGRIKNAYLRTLGAACGIVASGFFLLAWLIYAQLLSGFLANYSAFLLAAGAAAIGTWLSFSIRRVTLSFNDLGVLEDDLLDPSLRVLFVVTLTVAACLLFHTGAMNIEIGELKTKEFQGATAVLVGVFFGISERALATAISGRAAAFVRGVAGS